MFNPRPGIVVVSRVHAFRRCSILTTFHPHPLSRPRLARHENASTCQRFAAGRHTTKALYSRRCFAPRVGRAECLRGGGGRRSARGRVLRPEVPSERTNPPLFPAPLVMSEIVNLRRACSRYPGNGSRTWQLGHRTPLAVVQRTNSTTTPPPSPPNNHNILYSFFFYISSRRYQTSRLATAVGGSPNNLPPSINPHSFHLTGQIARMKGRAETGDSREKKKSDQQHRRARFQHKKISLLPLVEGHILGCTHDLIAYSDNDYVTAQPRYTSLEHKVRYNSPIMDFKLNENGKESHYIVYVIRNSWICVLPEISIRSATWVMITNPPTNGIVRHDSHMRKSDDPGRGIEPGSPWWGDADYPLLPLTLKQRPSVRSRSTGPVPLLRTGGHGGVVIRILASNHGEPGSIPGRVTRVFTLKTSLFSADQTFLTYLNHSSITSTTENQNGSAPECKGWGDGRSPRKPADQRHRPPRFSLANIRKRHRWESNPAPLGGRRSKRAPKIMKKTDCKAGLDRGEAVTYTATSRYTRKKNCATNQRHVGAPFFTQRMTTYLQGRQAGQSTAQHAVANQAASLAPRGSHSQSASGYIQVRGTETCAAVDLESFHLQALDVMSFHLQALDLMSFEPTSTRPNVVSLTGTRRGVVVSLLASHLFEPGSIPGRITPGFSHVEIVPDDADGRRVFSRFSRIPRPFHSGAAPHSPRFTLVVSQDLDVQSNPNLFTHPNESPAYVTVVQCWDTETSSAQPAKSLYPILTLRIQEAAIPYSHLGEPSSILPLVSGFSRGSPVCLRSCMPPLLRTHLASHSSHLKAAVLRYAQTLFTPLRTQQNFVLKLGSKIFIRPLPELDSGIVLNVTGMPNKIEISDGLTSARLSVLRSDLMRRSR
ncbi:hypothetical protein PR048_030869 [Dryococelus australis]|uniref:Uncharacterized protein n=1 Tax=Dryococelus australis TaxID=614101 RepID=A0ABQ9GA53_9NEOP|nr:hypothetical protein PR048_030869 [Dryococelus australis]